MPYFIVFILAALLGASGSASYFSYVVQKKESNYELERRSQNDTIENILEDLAQATKLLEDRTLALRATEDDLVRIKEERDLFEAELTKVGFIDEQIRMITSTVGDLEKLKELDKELLQKYSKTFFLNEHYVPKKLSKIPVEWVNNPEKELSIHGDVLPFLLELLQTAKSSGIDISVLSAYRSFESQGDLKSTYTVTYGSGANQFSADQGYSEHQLGTTIDFTTSDLGQLIDTFGDTDTYAWLLQRAHEFGFVLSYPQNNIYYEWEPWHFRFVGKKLAWKLISEDRSFYEVNQRELDEYLIHIFD